MFKKYISTIKKGVAEGWRPISQNMTPGLCKKSMWQIGASDHENAKSLEIKKHKGKRVLED